MTAVSEPPKYNAFSEMERQEIVGLTQLKHIAKPNIPLKVNYDDILVKRFTSDLKFDPRILFNEILASAEKEVDNVIKDFAAKDSMSLVGLDSWQVKIGFLTINLCLHCFTKYDCGEEVFEDTAIHNVVVSISAQFDAKYVYCSPSHVTEVFEELNKFYCGLYTALGCLYLA